MNSDVLVSPILYLLSYCCHMKLLQEFDTLNSMKSDTLLQIGEQWDQTIQSMLLLAGIDHCVFDVWIVRVDETRFRQLFSILLMSISRKEQGLNIFQSYFSASTYRTVSCGSPPHSLEWNKILIRCVPESEQ